jgi:hypothetical protein
MAKTKSLLVTTLEFSISDSSQRGAMSNLLLLHCAKTNRDRQSATGQILNLRHLKIPPSQTRNAYFSLFERVHVLRRGDP